MFPGESHVVSTPDSEDDHVLRSIRAALDAEVQQLPLPRKQVPSNGYRAHLAIEYWTAGALALLPLSSLCPPFACTNIFLPNIHHQDQVLTCSVKPAAMVVMGGKATEAPCERVFSAASLVKNKPRNSLGAEVLDMKVFVKVNMTKLTRANNKALLVRYV